MNNSTRSAFAGKTRVLACAALLLGTGMLGFSPLANAQGVTEITVWFGRENFIPARPVQVLS